MTSGSDVVDLAGSWQLREAIGETWRWYAASRAPESLNSVAVPAAPAAPGAFAGWMPAAVPGSVVDALAGSGTIPDPRRGWGSRAAEWTGTRSWVLRRTVDLDGDWVGTDAVLELEGIDPGGRVFWNGREAAGSDGIYRRLRVPVEVERPGPQLLVVVVAPVPAGVPQVGRTEEVRRHAPRLGYGWDFCPPFPHQGIWRPVRLRRGARIAATRIHTSCDEAGIRGSVDVHLDVEAAAGETVRVSLDLGEGRPPITAESSAPSRGTVELVIDVPDPPLWWPACGAARTAELTVRVGTDERRHRIGFRHIAWVCTAGSPTAARAYGLRINGVDVPLPGANWAPADAQFGSVDPGRVAHLLDLAVAAGVRLLRVWGGGLVEMPEFYEACDERGLLVWQEFSQSSSGLQSAPSDDPAFLEALAIDARALVPERCRHPSLVLWGGGNELEGPDGPLATEQSAALMVLHDVVAELDPERGWLPTSPSGPVFHHRLGESGSADQHDVHGPWEFQGLDAQHTLADQGSYLAHTEFGVEGMANRRLWRHIVPEGLGEPADRSNPLHRHLGEWWNNALQVQELFGGGLDLDELRMASQWLQASGLATALEADRRRWPRTSMVLPWQLAESYPNTWGTALVGFDGEPKPALAAVARAFAPERATLRTARTAWAGSVDVVAEAWLWSESGRPAGGALELSILDLAGRVLATERTRAPAVRHPVAVADLTAPVPVGPFLWRARWIDADGELIDDELLLQTGDGDLSGLRRLPRTTLEVEALAEGWSVRNTGDTAAVGWGARDVRPGGDPRPLAALGDPRPTLPGEQRQLRRVSGKPRDGELIVDAWNADARRLPPLRKDAP